MVTVLIPALKSLKKITNQKSSLPPPGSTAAVALSLDGLSLLGRGGEVARLQGKHLATAAAGAGQQHSKAGCAEGVEAASPHGRQQRRTTKDTPQSRSHRGSS